MEVDWDLHAVVRGCAASSSTTAAATATDGTAPSNGHDQLFSSTSSQQQDYCSFSSAAAASTFQDLFEPRKERPVEELHDLYKPFVVNRQLSSSQESSSQVLLSPGNIPISPLSVLGGLQDPPSELQQKQQVIIKSLPPQQNQLLQKQQQQQLFSIGSSNHSSKAGALHNPSSRSKKRKNHLKKVCHVAAENLSSDIWSWRKYGQKPIKGSPYPRGYYKCSTSKGCMARKQVERNKSDPGMFIVTYTAEHNHPMPTHRSSLAGSTRQKPDDTPNSDEPKNITTSSEMSPVAALSPVLEKLESSRDDLVEPEDDDDDSISASNMAMEDDFFAGLDDFGPGLDGGKSISDQFPADLLLPWVSDSATAAAAGSG